MRKNAMILAPLLLAAATAATAAGAAWAAGPVADAGRSPASSFTERCGGCHGLQGVSVPDRVPSLRRNVGYYLCTPEGRDYAIRLPNVAFSQLSDRDLAEMMNYVMFTLGEGSAPAGARPYGAAEVGRLRRQPLAATDLLERRRAVVAGITAACQGAQSLWNYQIAAEKRANPGAHP